MIFWSGGVCSLVGSIAVGPRYGLYMDKETLDQVKGGGRAYQRKNLPAMLEEQKNQKKAVDEMTL